MFTFHSGTEIHGAIPAGLNLEDLLDKNRLEELAVEVYDRNPNILARVDSDNSSYVIKWFGWRNPLHFWLSPTFPSRAQASWNTARALTSAGTRTPEPLFVYTRRDRGFIHENIYITQSVHPHQTFRQLLKNTTGDDREPPFPVIEDLARSLVRMHNAGIFHRDLTTGNFLVDEENQVWLVDLNRAVKKSSAGLSVDLRIKDLAKIHFGALDSDLTRIWMDRFFNVYGQGTSVPDTRWGELYTKARRHHRRRRQRKQQLKRSLRR